MVLHRTLLAFATAACLAVTAAAALAGPVSGKGLAKPPTEGRGGGGSSSGGSGSSGSSSGGGAGAGSPSPGPGTCSVTDSSVTATACSGYLSGNTSAAGVAAMIANEHWSGWSGPLVEFKDDMADFDSDGSTTPLFDVVQTDEDDGSLGLLTFLQPINGPFILALKGGNAWAGYLIDGDFTAGDRIRFDIPGKQGAGLSHASVFATALDESTPPTSAADVPEPGTLVLAGLGLAAIGAGLRRRRN